MSARGSGERFDGGEGRWSPEGERCAPVAHERSRADDHHASRDGLARHTLADEGPQQRDGLQRLAETLRGRRGSVAGQREEAQVSTTLPSVRWSLHARQRAQGGALERISRHIVGENAPVALEPAEAAHALEHELHSAEAGPNASQLKPEMHTYRTASPTRSDLDIDVAPKPLIGRIHDNRTPRAGEGAATS